MARRLNPNSQTSLDRWIQEVGGRESAEKILYFFTGHVPPGLLPELIALVRHTHPQAAWWGYRHRYNAGQPFPWELFSEAEMGNPEAYNAKSDAAKKRKAKILNELANSLEAV